MEPIYLELTDCSKTTQVKKVLEPLVIDDQKALKIKTIFKEELEKGLKYGLKGSSLQMENTYFQMESSKLPTCNGKYLALDLGSTNFRVMLIEMSNGVITNELVEYYTVVEATRLGPGEALFDFLAQCIADFIQENKLGTNELPLGFTFSFPMEQQGLDAAELVAWTKSYNAAGVVGQNVVKMLSDAIKRHGNLKVNVVAILNDATGTLVKGAYDDPDTAISLILGTGCNGAYLEAADKVLNWHSSRDEHVQEVIIDPEFGAFGDNGCIDFVKTDFDKELDANSLLPGGYTFEKYLAGKFIGELARLVLVQLHKQGLFMQQQHFESFC